MKASASVRVDRGSKIQSTYWKYAILEVCTLEKRRTTREDVKATSNRVMDEERMEEENKDTDSDEF